MLSCVYNTISILGKVEGERWETNINRAIFYIDKVQKRAIFWAKARYFEGEFSHAPAFFPSMNVPLIIICREKHGLRLINPNESKESGRAKCFSTVICLMIL